MKRRSAQVRRDASGLGYNANPLGQSAPLAHILPHLSPLRRSGPMRVTRTSPHVPLHPHRPSPICLPAFPIPTSASPSAAARRHGNPSAAPRLDYSTCAAASSVENTSASSPAPVLVPVLGMSTTKYISLPPSSTDLPQLRSGLISMNSSSIAVVAATAHQEEHANAD